jgi:hypothetical protein
VRHWSATRRAICGLGLASLLHSPTAGASPLDLSNPTPRWIAVAFEVSPPDQPARRQTRYTRRLPAQLEPGPLPGELRIRVAGELVERFLLSEHAPIPGSFGDFSWIFDAHTGHVRSAELSGSVQREMGWGFASWTVEARIEVRMSTHAAVAFRAAKVVGEAVHRICPQPAKPDCTLVAPTRLDPETGYVNAVGSIHADSGPLQLDSFSPLGEAIFTEIDGLSDAIWSTAYDPAVHADAGTPPHSE